jgi:hypothetical protein
MEYSMTYLRDDFSTTPLDRNESAGLIPHTFILKSRAIATRLLRSPRQILEKSYVEMF